MEIITYLDQNAVMFLELVLTITVGMMVRDFVSNFIAGCMFWISSDFKAGERVVIDGQPGVVVKIGLRKTIFGIVCPHGYVWRYVLNTRIAYLSLEKIIREDVNE